MGACWRLWQSFLFVLIVGAFGGSPQAHAETESRHALVIGNANYIYSPLKNPVNDAQDMSKALRRLGFEVTTLIDADLRQMRRAAIEFGRNLSNKGGVGLFYYAGHGMQVDGENFLIPLEAAIEVEDHVAVEAMSVNQVLARMGGAKNRMNIVILDACRNNPLNRSMRSAAKGLAQTDAPFGTYISFATAPGQVAADGDGRNGLYTSALLKALDEPGLRIEETFKHVRSEVVASTDSRQVPWTSSSIVGDFVFLDEPETVELEFEDVEDAVQQETEPRLDQRETALWQAVSNGGTEADYRTYLTVYPEGLYAALAQARIAALSEEKKTRALETQQEQKELKAVREELEALKQQKADTNQGESQQQLALLAAMKEELEALKKRETSNAGNISKEQTEIEALKKQLVAQQAEQVLALQKQVKELAEKQAIDRLVAPVQGENRQLKSADFKDLAAVPELSDRVDLSELDGALIFAEVETFQDGALKDTKFFESHWRDGYALMKAHFAHLVMKVDAADDEVLISGQYGRSANDRERRGILERIGPNMFEGRLHRMSNAWGYRWVMRIKIIPAPVS